MQISLHITNETHRCRLTEFKASERKASTRHEKPISSMYFVDLILCLEFMATIIKWQPYLLLHYLFIIIISCDCVMGSCAMCMCKEKNRWIHLFLDLKYFLKHFRCFICCRFYFSEFLRCLSLAFKSDYV